MQARGVSDRAFTLYRLLVGLVALVITVSLGLACHHSRIPKLFFADLKQILVE